MPYTPGEAKSISTMNTFTMNTNTITKLVLAATGIISLGFLGLTKIHADFLPILGLIVSYGAAVVILVIAASDNYRRKPLT